MQFAKQTIVFQLLVYHTNSPPPKQSSEPAFHILLPTFFIAALVLFYPTLQDTLFTPFPVLAAGGLQLSDQKICDFDLHALKNKIK
jgi:hypothetical protein